MELRLVRSIAKSIPIIAPKTVIDLELHRNEEKRLIKVLRWHRECSLKELKDVSEITDLSFRDVLIKQYADSADFHRECGLITISTIRSVRKSIEFEIESARLDAEFYRKEALS